ncbi:MAG: undecaprenyldiphospho-muramoylpentapeptide beta-N-acetylglucosaminyltransferase [Clostridiaceae bacterium]|nr:undecaprenyldiphospho-muramoylpentapeptide beta-N-acetylglucosaminyltransferase [Eubacteriales bacterium]
MAKRILLTGGGSAGHVTPNLALIPRLKAEGFEIHYVGTADGKEHKLVASREDVTYHVISAGKLRRYFSLQNFIDPFRTLKGLVQARRIQKSVDPDVVFSKGGFVSLPVVLAARAKTPVVTHESDYTPGLANRIIAMRADKICVTFEDTLKFTRAKGVHTGTPIRPELYGGSKEEGLKILGFSGEKPVLLAMGGSQGAQAINAALRAALPELCKRFDVAHLCGEGKRDESIRMDGYVQCEYMSEELPHVLAAADLVVSRAGANSIFEFLALAKPALLIPLPQSKVSRGDQIVNAGYFQKKGYAAVLPQEKLTPETLIAAVDCLFNDRGKYADTMRDEKLNDGTEGVLRVIREAAERGRKK